MNKKNEQITFEQFSAIKEEQKDELYLFMDLMDALEDRLDDARKDYTDLSDWYFGGSWLQDRDYEDKHPLDQPCGIYSEDELYDLLTGISARASDLIHLLKPFCLSADQTAKDPDEINPDEDPSD